MTNFFKALAVPMIAFATNIALMQIAAAQQIGTIGIGDISVSAKQSQFATKQAVHAAFDKSINGALIDTRKFTVLHRPQVEARLLSQGLTLDGYYSGEYRKAGLYDQIGLDHILKVDVSKFAITSANKGGVEAKVALVDLDYQMFGVADLTQDFKATISTQVALKGDATSTQQLFDQAVAKSVERLTQHLSTTLFPIRVVKISEDFAITLNYGKGYLAAGDTLKVYANDADIALGSSGEPIGNAIATLQITSADQKFSLAQALTGAGALKKGLPAYVLRAN